MNTLGEGPYVPSRRRGRPEIYTPQHPDPDPSQDQASDSGQASTMGEYDGRQCGITCTWTISDIVSESASALEPQRTLDWPWTVRLATVGKLCHPRKVSIRISGFGRIASYRFAHIFRLSKSVKDNNTLPSVPYSDD